MRLIFLFLTIFSSPAFSSGIFGDLLENLHYGDILTKDELERKNIFIGDVTTKWLDEQGEDRRMQLLGDFAFVDGESTIWQVPKDWIIDGASIPRIYWALVGSPFTGDYRKASVIHDYYCDVKTVSWERTHLMFFNASIAAGVPVTKAKLMYSAVYLGGPRWRSPYKDPADHSNSPIESGLQDFQPNLNYTDAELNQISTWITTQNPTIEMIESELSKIRDKKINSQ